MASVSATAALPKPPAGVPGDNEQAGLKPRAATTTPRPAQPAPPLVSAGILLLALITTIAAIRVRRADLAGAQDLTGQRPPSA